VADEILGGSIGGHGAVAEADQIGEAVIPKDNGQIPCLALQTVGPIELFRLEDMALPVAMKGLAQAPAQHALVGDDPLKTLLLHDGDNGRAHGLLRRPQTPRLAAKALPVDLLGPLQLAVDILLPVEGVAGQGQAGPSHPRRALAHQQGQDGMGVGAGGQLQLAALLQLGVLGQDGGQDLLLLGIDPLPIRQGKAGSHLDPALDLGILVEEGIEPGEVVPGQQVAEVLRCPVL
jgi:hypothetical protein